VENQPVFHYTLYACWYVLASMLMKPVFLSVKLLWVVAVALVLVSCGSSRRAASGSSKVPALQPEPESKSGRIGNPAMYERKIRSKYASYMGVSPESIRNVDLFIFIDQWLYTPYKYAGTTKDGVDCSGFVQRLLSEVYNQKIVRKSSAAFYKQNTEHYSGRHSLNEGDVLFFQTGSGKDITHMGLYVGNRMFVHASSSLGVSIASLDNQYWQPRYAGAGSVIKGSK
jgi:murein DD-endopeptidase / murein LD-carboxypeptidase